MKKLLFLPLISILLGACSGNDVTTSFSSIDIIIGENPHLVTLHTPVQSAFINDKKENVNLYARGVEELSRPTKPQISWDNGIGEYKITLSEYEDYSTSFIYQTSDASYSFTNLKIDTTYYYKVEDDLSIIKEDYFTTSNEIIRTMYVSGVTNVRDLGGYMVDGYRTKQGLIYRGGRLNQNSTEVVTNKINEKGIKTMLEDIKLSSEIDLRYVDNNEVGMLTEGVGVLGESVKYYQCPMEYNSGRVSGEDNDASLRKVFTILGDESNYPTYFHCSIGTDRTGYVAWLINAVIGVEEEYLWKDYLFSNFANIGGSRNVDTIKNGYVKDISTYAGSTLKEKANRYLLDKGVKQSDIDTLRNMMKGA